MGTSCLLGLVVTATVTGTVTWSSRTPPQAVQAPHDGQVCGQTGPVYRRRIQVGPNGGVASVVISLDPGVGSEESTAAFIDQINCQFEPRVVRLAAGSTLTIGNDDAVLHNVHITDRWGKSVANYAMPVRGQRTPPLVLNEPGVYRLRCDAGHHWMNAWIQVFDHGASAMSDEQGRFRLSAPAGRYEMTAWHPDLGTVKVPVVLTDEAPTNVELTF